MQTEGWDMLLAAMPEWASEIEAWRREGDAERGPIQRPMTDAEIVDRIAWAMRVVTS